MKKLVIMVITIILLLPFEVKALANINGNTIINTAKTYENYTYYGVGTCTGLVTRTLNKLDIATSIVGIHPYNIDLPQSSGGAKFNPTKMYNNAINSSEARLIWQGKVIDIPSISYLLKNGDLVIQRVGDKFNNNKTGHVAFIHKYDGMISMYGANNQKYGIGDVLLYDPTYVNKLYISNQDFISVFRLAEVLPIFQVTNKTISIDNTININVLVKENDNYLNNVNVVIYKDDVKQIDSFTNDEGIASYSYNETINATSSDITYLTNYNDLDLEDKFNYQNSILSLSAAEKLAETEAQNIINEKLMKTNNYKVEIENLPDDFKVEVFDNEISLKANESHDFVINLKRITGSTKITFNNDLLDGSYGLYASDAIIDSLSKKIIYNKDELINEEEINNNEILVDNLYLGKYYFKEIKESSNYEKDLNKYNFEISIDNLENAFNLTKQRIQKYENSVIELNYTNVAEPKEEINRPTYARIINNDNKNEEKLLDNNTNRVYIKEDKNVNMIKKNNPINYEKESKNNNHLVLIISIVTIFFILLCQIIKKLSIFK